MKYFDPIRKIFQPALSLLLACLLSANISAQNHLLDFEQHKSVRDSLSFGGRLFNFTSEISNVYASGGKFSLLCNEEDGNRGSVSVRRGSFDFKSVMIRRAWGNFPIRIEGYLQGRKVFSKKSKVGTEFKKVGLFFSRETDSLVFISEKKINPLYIDDLQIELINLPLELIEEPKKEPVVEEKPKTEIIAENKTEKEPEVKPVTDVVKEEKTLAENKTAPEKTSEEKPKTEIIAENKTEKEPEVKPVTDVVKEEKTLAENKTAPEKSSEEKPKTEIVKEETTIPDDPNRLYVLGFEEEKSGSVHLIENKHKFRATTGISEQFPADGKQSWAASDRSGDFGELTVMVGSINIKSLKIRRSWGHFKAIIRAFRGDNLFAEYQLEVGTDYYEHELNWEGVSRLTVTSEKKYNPLFIDQINYVFNLPGKELPPVKDLIRIGFDKEDQIAEDKRIEKESRQVSKTQSVDGESKMGPKSYSLGFENTPDAGTWVKENGHTFECRSGISSVFSASGRKSLRGQENHGTTAEIRVQSGQIELESFGMRSSDVIHEVRMMGFLMGELQFDVDYRIGPEFRKYNGPESRRVDQIFFISYEKYHNVYLDRLQYKFAPGDRNHTFTEDPSNAKLPAVQADSVQSGEVEDNKEPEKPDGSGPKKKK